MGLLEDTGEYPEIEPGGAADPPLVLDPYKGYVLGERLDLRSAPDPSYGYASLIIRRDRCLGGPTVEQSPVLEPPRWRQPTAFLGSLLARMADSRVIDRLERAIFK